MLMPYLRIILVFLLLLVSISGCSLLLSCSIAFCLPSLSTYSTCLFSIPLLYFWLLLALMIDARSNFICYCTCLLTHLLFIRIFNIFILFFITHSHIRLSIRLFQMFFKATSETKRLSILFSDIR